MKTCKNIGVLKPMVAILTNEKVLPASPDTLGRHGFIRNLSLRFFGTDILPRKEKIHDHRRNGDERPDG